MAVVFVSWTTAPLVAQYADAIGETVRPPVKDALTMAGPRCDARRYGAAAFVQYQTPRRLISYTRSHTSSGSVSTDSSPVKSDSWTPALLCRTSIPPNRSAAPSIRAWTCPRSRTSQCMNSASPPASWTSPTVSAPPSSLTSLTTTRAPRRDISRAVARPMPPPEPVTTQTLSSSTVQPSSVCVDHPNV